MMYRVLVVPYVLLAMTAVSLPTSAADEPKDLVRPRNLPCNTKADEDEPHVTSGGNVLYYSSNPKGKLDIFVSTRANPRQKWGPGKIPDDYLQTKGDDCSVFVLADGRYPQYLVYASKKDNKEAGANFDLYVAVRQGPGKAFSSPTPVQATATPEDEMHPWITADGKELYFSRKTKDGWRVFVAPRPNPFGPLAGDPKLVEELPPDFHHATVTPDGKTMYVQGPLGKGRWGLFISKKSKDGWSKPEPLDTLNHPDGPTGDRSPNLSRDGSVLYFASDRPGGQGGLDLYVIETKELMKKK
jgi:Tol biopolymer transport system component